MDLKGNKYFIYHMNGEFPPKLLIGAGKAKKRFIIWKCFVTTKSLIDCPEKWRTMNTSHISTYYMGIQSE